MAIAPESNPDRDWRALLPELLTTILRSLRLADNIRSGAVCRSWCSAAAQTLRSLGPHPPFLLLPGDSTGTSDNFQLFNLSDQRFYKIRLPHLRNRRSIGSSEGKIIYIDERADLHVLDPITGSHFDLPSILTFPDVSNPQFDDEGNILSYSYSGEISPAHHFVAIYYSKAIICPKTSAIFAIASLQEHVAFCRPGDRSWTVIDTDSVEDLRAGIFVDIVFYKGELYAITNLGHLVSFDQEEDSRKIKFKILGQALRPFQVCRYLVEAEGEMLQVFRRVRDDVIGEDESQRINVTEGFEVYKMNWSMMRWEKVKAIGECALFLGFNSSFSLSTRDFPELKANAIYFTDDNYECHVGIPQLKRDLGVFHLDDGSIKPCYPGDGDLHLNWPPPIWFTAKMPRD